MKNWYLRFQTISLLALTATISAGCSSQDGGDQPDGAARLDTSERKPTLTRMQTTATIEPKGDSRMTGTAVFIQAVGKVVLRLKVENAPPGTHAVHLHQIGDCSSPDGKSAGGHWNPRGVDHGRWGTDPFHSGDIGNMNVDQTGQGSYTLMTDLWSIGGAEDSNVVGRAIIIHAGVDDFMTQPTGNAGGRIGCGVIQMQEMKPRKKP